MFEKVVVLFIWRSLEKNLEAVCGIFSYAVFFGNIICHNPFNLKPALSSTATDETKRNRKSKMN